jgi:hypothetical protein
VQRCPVGIAHQYVETLWTTEVRQGAYTIRALIREQHSNAMALAQKLNAFDAEPVRIQNKVI